jgi:serine/threonine-protein kinase
VEVPLRIVERFRREAQAVAMLNHPNVVQIIDRDQDGDALYFVMEYVAGVSLDAVLRQRRLSLREALEVLGEVCAGLEAAHDADIVHRDLNPRNVLVSEDLSVVKLADFGISRVESISQAMGTLSTASYSMGVLAYMAPEQVKDMAQVDHRADIYSAGVLLYRMLTGSVPIAKVEKPSRLNSDVPVALDPIVLRCLATDPSKRFASVRQLRGALKTVEERLDPRPSEESPEVTRIVTRLVPKTTETPKAARGRPLAFVLGALAVILLAGGSALLWMGRSSEQRVETVPTVQTQLAPRYQPSQESDGKGGGDFESDRSSSSTSR